MSGEIPNVAKYVFLLHFILGLVFGVWYFLAPEIWNDVTGWPSEIASGRIVGAALLVFGIASFLAYRATSWDQVELYVIMEILWNLIALIGMVWNLLVMTLPLAGWLMSGLLGLFVILFLYVYLQKP